MARDQFGDDRFRHSVKREVPGFFGHACVEHDLKQQVAKFIAHRRHVAALCRIGNFVGFLDCMRNDRGKGLRTVPLAAQNRVAQTLHDAKEVVQWFRHIRLIIYIMLNNGLGKHPGGCEPPDRPLDD